MIIKSQYATGLRPSLEGKKENMLIRKISPKNKYTIYFEVRKQN